MARRTGSGHVVSLNYRLGNGVVQRVPYTDVAGFRFVLDEVAVRRPEAKKMNVDELIDNRFVRELEDSCFVKSLYGGK
jgi:hypothetical protein